MNRESIWNIMESYGIARKKIHMVQMLYEHSECEMLDEGKEFEWFNVKVGVKQVLRINSKCTNRILINDQELKEVDKYNYLGANVSKQGGGGDDIVNIISKAWISFVKLKQIWSSDIYTLRSKVRLLTHLLNQCCCMEVKHEK